MKTLVVGIGNLLLCDEGVGVHVARALHLQDLGPEISVMDVGTSYLDALPEIGRADRIIVVDAMHGGEEAGTIYRVPFEDCVRPLCIGSLHGFDLSRALFLSGRDSVPEVIVIGVEPSRIKWDTELSPTIQTSLPVVLEVVKREARAAISSSP